MNHDVDKDNNNKHRCLIVAVAVGVFIYNLWMAWGECVRQAISLS